MCKNRCTLGFHRWYSSQRKKDGKTFPLQEKKVGRKPFFFLFSPSPDVTLLMPSPSKSVQGGDFIPPQGPFSESFSDSKILGFQRREGQKRSLCVLCFRSANTDLCSAPNISPPPHKGRYCGGSFFFARTATRKAFKNCPLAMREMAGRRRCGFAVG